ncbi:terminase large subunit [Schleiferilactobacillus harbinensis]|uniref:Terminase large subunit n=1 Tax=Schleiferilactobacillus harbinensis TaxID=304207 RepID=A0ABU7T353_9LACO
MKPIDLTQSHDVLAAYHLGNYDDVRNTYPDVGTQYAFDVLEGKQQAGYMIQLAAFRHIRDLQRVLEKEADFPYHYSLNKVTNILKFAAICPNVDHTDEPTELMPWQAFILAQLIGWRGIDGGKRFSRAIVSVGRTNGKTYLMAIIACYSFLVESLGLSSQDYLVASINFKQTSKILGYIKTMLRKILDIEPFKSLAEEVGLNPDGLSSQSDQIVQSKQNNVLRAISHESGQYDSFHFTTAIFDEIGEITSRDKIKKIVSGQVQIANKQFIEISTAYPNPTVPFHDDEKTMQQAMEQDYKRDGDTQLCLVWAQDHLEDAYKPETWVESNPLLDLREQHEILMSGLKDKRANDLMAGSIDDFQNKNMNMWLQESQDSFLKLADVERAVVSHFDVTGRDVYIGFDYSMFSDNTAIGFVFPYESNGHKYWHIAQHSFIPWQKAGSIEAKEKQDGIGYRELAKKGYCTITSHPEGIINDDQVYSWLTDYVSDHHLHVLCFGYDAMGATRFVKQLELNSGWNILPVKQRTGELKDPTKFLQIGFIEGSIKRLDDKIMEKALLNAQIYEDKVGIQVDKAKATLKIDVVDALIDAFYQGMYHFDDFGIANDRTKQVERMTPEQVKKMIESGKFGFGGDAIG